MDEVTAAHAALGAAAADAALTVVPAIPTREWGLEAILSGKVGLESFVGLATRFGGGMLYLAADRFTLDEDDQDLPDAAEYLAREGQIGVVTAAFVANGVLHIWEEQAGWHLALEQTRAAATRPSRFRPLASAEPGPLDGEQTDSYPSVDMRSRFGLMTEAERAARQAREAALTDVLVAAPEYRAAKLTERSRIARAMASEEDQDVVWGASREATDRVLTETHTIYRQLRSQFDKFADELAADATYQNYSSPAGRKVAVEQFLIAHADGLMPPNADRDELYARVQDRVKGRARGGGLF